MHNLMSIVDPTKIKEVKIEVERFIELYNEGKVELLDVRMPFERDVWSVNFGLKIPAPELPDNLDKLPKDKFIICACAEKDRSVMAMSYLRTKGFNAGYLDGGLLELIPRLKGGKAKDLNLGK
jgi:rhodanese-related sulfurtransferase